MEYVRARQGAYGGSATGSALEVSVRVFLGNEELTSRVRVVVDDRIDRRDASNYLALKAGG